MNIPRELSSLSQDLNEDGGATNSALIRLAELLDLWSESMRTGRPALLSDEEIRMFVRSILIQCIDRDPGRPIAATAIWVLGKLYDKSLEHYLAALVEVFMRDPQHGGHLHQALIALDNLEVLPPFPSGEFRDEDIELRKIADEYLEARKRKI